MDRPIFFLHIPKTAGTVFKTMLSKERSTCPYYYPRGYYDNREEISNSNYEIYAGHMPYSAIKFLDKEFNIITFLRHPIDRIYSQWKEIQRYKYLPRATFDEFIYHPEYKNLTKNYMSKYLVLNPDWKYNRKKKKWEHHNVFEKLPIGMSDTDLIFEAFRILDTFSFVGITEHFGESIDRINKKYSLRLPKTTTKVSRYKDKISKNTYEKLVERNKVDLQLYDTWLNIFEEKE